MIASLKSYFSDKKECFEIHTEKEFEVFDHEEEKKCYIVSENGQFTVFNPKKKEIGFIAIDECLFSSSDDSRADCAIYDIDTYCLIELKDCKIKNIPVNRRRAKKQLIASLEFLQKNIKINKKLEAYICVTCTRDNKTTMIPRADNQEAKAEFEELYHTKLEYLCEKNFN